MNAIYSTKSFAENAISKTPEVTWEYMGEDAHEEMTSETTILESLGYEVYNTNFHTEYASLTFSQKQQ